MKESETRRDFGRGVVTFTSLGFPDQSGKEGLANRQVFAEFFLYDNIQALYNPMSKIMETNIADFINTNKINGTEYTSIDIRDFITKSVLDWITLLIFGYESASELSVEVKKYPELKKIEIFNQRYGEDQKVNLIVIIQLFLDCTCLIFMDPFNSFCYGWPLFFRLRQLYRDQKNLDKFINKLILEQYDKRFEYFEQNKGTNSASNVIDLMCEHNYKCKKNNNFADIISNKTIVGNIAAISFAAIDTTTQATTSGIMHMAQNHQQWFTKIRNEGLENLDQIKNNNSLMLVIKEILRLFNPVGAGFTRFLLKDTTIAGVKLKKGNAILIPYGWKKWNNKYVDAKKFNPERFLKEIPQLERYDYIPFSEGKRKCIGHNLAEVNMKLLIGNLLKKFDLKVEKSFKIGMDNDAVYKVRNPTIDVKLRV